MKNIVTVDYTNILHYTQLHTILRDAMGWPDWYGCNLDALWDIFWCEGAPEQLIFHGTRFIYRHEGWGESWEQMLSVLDAVVAEWHTHGWKFSYVILD